MLAMLLFTPLHPEEADTSTQISLSLNIDEGSYLQLSNGKLYEVAPEDRFYSTYWITPFPLTIEKSKDPDFPVKIINLRSGTSVKAKEVDTKFFLERSRERLIEENAKKKALPKRQLQTPSFKKKKSNPSQESLNR